VKLCRLHIACAVIHSSSGIAVQHEKTIYQEK